MGPEFREAEPIWITDTHRRREGNLNKEFWGRREGFGLLGLGSKREMERKKVSGGRK